MTRSLGAREGVGGPGDDRVDGHIARGELGRAKEILSSRLRQTGYDTVTIERLGRVLLAMGDTIEAGRMLFLVRRGDAHQDTAVEAFLRRCRNMCLPDFVAQWHRGVRRVRVLDLPEAAREELENRGMGPADATLTLEAVRGRAIARRMRLSRFGYLILAAAVLIVVYVLT